MAHPTPNLGNRCLACAPRRERLLHGRLLANASAVALLERIIIESRAQGLDLGAEVSDLGLQRKHVLTVGACAHVIRRVHPHRAAAPCCVETANSLRIHVLSVGPRWKRGGASRRTVRPSGRGHGCLRRALAKARVKERNARQPRSDRGRRWLRRRWRTVAPRRAAVPGRRCERWFSGGAAAVSRGELRRGNPPQRTSGDRGAARADNTQGRCGDESAG
mmetsp:Transcript_86639/g.242718  ORF Transcript_86639/g.242718 Transcript_86639/m.242718 type:complete len:219 (-) Transcript_86639:151-807(-)